MVNAFEKLNSSLRFSPAERAKAILESNSITPWLDSKIFSRNHLAVYYFRKNCTVTHSHLKPWISFHFDEKNYSFTCSKCNESIGSSFVTQDNKIPTIPLTDYGFSYTEILTANTLGDFSIDFFYYFDDYFSAFMENNIPWFSYHTTWRLLKVNKRHLVKGCHLN